MIRGLIALLLVVVLWGSSFPVIKIVVGDIGGFRYTWFRGLIAFLVLTPFTIPRLFREDSHRIVYGGLLTGIVYAIGLWLQGTGTGYTTASNSAFITGLNVVFVHLYVALRSRRYDPLLGGELLLALSGLYLLTNPRGGINYGDLLVLASAVMWAIQVLLVSEYGGRDPILFTWVETAPSILFIVPDQILYPGLSIGYRSVLGLIYLGIACSAGAFTLQAYGQKYIPPEIAALTYLLEPVFASIFAWFILREYFTLLQYIGASLILFSTGLANWNLYHRGSKINEYST